MKIGDKVRIINPTFFKKCGYKYGAKEAEDIFRDDLKLEGHTIESKLCEAFPWMGRYGGNHKLVKELVYEYNALKLKFGGDDRILHFFDADPDLMGEFATIIDRKVHVTGTRVQGGGYDDPTLLINQNRHVLFKLDVEPSHQHSILAPNSIGGSNGLFVNLSLCVTNDAYDKGWILKEYLELVQPARV